MATKKPLARPKVRSADAAIGQELGITNILPASSWQDWSGGPVPPGTLAVGRDPLAPTRDELVYMLRRDGQARALLNLLTLPIRAAFTNSKWVMPDGNDGPEAEFANLVWNLPSNIGGMSTPSSMFLRQTLLGLAHGFSAFEIVRQIPEEGPLAGFITIDKMGYRDPRTVTFLSDEHGNYQGFRQQTNFGMRYINVVIPKEDSWYFAANEEENPFYGVSLFEPAYQHYQAKRKLYYIAELASQLAAVPGRIGEIPLGASPRQIEEFKRSLSNFAFNTAMVTPPNFKVTPFNGNSGFDFLKLIDHHNTMMAGSILAKFLQQEDRQVLIDNGKADASADFFVQMLEAVTAELSGSWSTKLMPQFIDLNFGSGNYPVHQFAPLTDATKDAILQIFETVVAATALNCTPEFVRQTEMKLAERLDYDIDYEKVAQEEEQAAAEQQAAAEAAQQQAAQPQGSNLDGSPVGGTTPQQQGPQGATAQNPGGNPRTTGAPKNPVVATSAEHQEGLDLLAMGLSKLMTEDDVPEEWLSEPEVLPEAGE